MTDPSFPHLETATDPELMKKVFQRYLRSFHRKDSRVRKCMINLLQKRRGHCILHYTLRLGKGGQGRKGRRQMITGFLYTYGRARRRFEELSAYEPDRSIPGSSTIPTLFFYVSELDMLAQVFPHDHRLPALSILMAGLPPELESLLPALLGPGDWRVEAWDAEQIRYRVAARATLRVTLRARDHATGRLEGKRYYAKVYPNEQQAEQTYQVLEQLWNRASMGDETFTVGRPVAYLSGLRTVLQEEVSGSSLDEVLRREEEPTWTVRKVARFCEVWGQRCSDG